MTDTTSTVPLRDELRPKVFIQGPGAFQYIMMFLNRGYKGTHDLAAADLVCFTGGEDVDPQLYGERAIQQTHFNSLRDRKDMEVYETAERLGVPMVGICRGGQFLNVMNGGKMWQDVDHHVQGHFLYDTVSEKRIWVSSTHHQMMIPSATGFVLALAEEARNWKSDSKHVKVEKNLRSDVEAIWYEDTDCLCFQPHPEFPRYEACTDYFFELLEKYIDPWGVAAARVEWAEELDEDEENDDADLALDSAIDRFNKGLANLGEPTDDLDDDVPFELRAEQAH